MLGDYRQKIDAIDDEIAKLFSERMQLVELVAQEKIKTNTATFDSSREKDIINRVTRNVKDNIKVYTKQVFQTLFEVSRGYQNRIMAQSKHSDNFIFSGLQPQAFPVNATVACQGVSGAFSGIATEKVFPISEITYFKDFNSVFNAVEKGLCEFGVLPIENSSVGSVNAVYDLMRKHNFYIVRSVKQRVRHQLLAKKGVKLSDIKEIFSHEQALSQCSQFLEGLNAKTTVLTNTATSAKFVAESDRKDIACIASNECASLYGLEIVSQNVEDNGENYTRFICITKQFKLYEHSNKISLMVRLPHESGSLNKLLNKFSVLNLNLTKLESRPILGSFEFMFYFDFDAYITDIEVQSLLSQLQNSGIQFTFLGSYLEVQ